jgi:hypothetical protein
MTVNVMIESGVRDVKVLAEDGSVLDGVETVAVHLRKGWLGTVVVDFADGARREYTLGEVLVVTDELPDKGRPEKDVSPYDPEAVKKATDKKKVG